MVDIWVSFFGEQGHYTPCFIREDLKSMCGHGLSVLTLEPVEHDGKDLWHHVKPHDCSGEQHKAAADVVHDGFKGGKVFHGIS